VMIGVVTIVATIGAMITMTAAMTIVIDISRTTLGAVESQPNNG
jgi:hypothetical protein